MSPDIWTSCAGLSRAEALATEVWRVVEAQHRVSTRRLVDTLDEQDLLESIIDELKPPRPAGAAFLGLHYLLFTPFRHPPLDHGSRFGRRDQRSIFYAAEAVETALAEKAYYALLFLEGSVANLEPSGVDWTAFNVQVRSKKGIDLLQPPFAAHTAEISSPRSYVVSQAVGAAMRADGIEIVRFASARCPDHGANVGLFEPAFSKKLPTSLNTWRCLLTRTSCEVFRLNGSRPTVLEFPRSIYEIEGRLPRPAV